MDSIITALLRLFIRVHLSKMLDMRVPIEKQRAILEKAGRFSLRLSMTKPTIEKGMLHAVPTDWINRHLGEQDQAVILYFHGGGFILGSPVSHSLLATNISFIAQMPVALIDYRLAPEHPYPAAHNDCLAAYQALLDMGYAHEKIILGGDSAGGFFVLQTLLLLKAFSRPLPKAAFLLSPLCDALHFDGPTYITCQSKDPWLKAKYIPQLLDLYLQTTSPMPNILCPLSEDLSGLPDLYIQVGTDEVLLSDSLRLQEQSHKDGTACQLDVYSGMWHVFQAFAPILPEARRAIKDIGRFINTHLKKDTYLGTCYKGEDYEKSFSKSCSSVSSCL